MRYRPEITGSKPKFPNKDLVAKAKEFRRVAQTFSSLLVNWPTKRLDVKQAKTKIENGISTRRREQ